MRITPATISDADLDDLVSDDEIFGRLIEDIMFTPNYAFPFPWDRVAAASRTAAPYPLCIIGPGQYGRRVTEDEVNSW